jgi:hypothetical protein
VFAPRPACGERSKPSASGEGDSRRLRMRGNSPSPRPSPRKRGEGEVERMIPEVWAKSHGVVTTRSARDHSYRRGHIASSKAFAATPNRLDIAVHNPRGRDEFSVIVLAVANRALQA